MTVVKIGGSILADRAAYHAMARRVAGEAARGATWVVVSAAKGITDRLIALAESPSQAEVEALLAHHVELAGGQLPPWLRRELRRTAACGCCIEALMAWGERASAEILRLHLRRLDAHASILEFKARWPDRIDPIVILPGFYHRDARRRIRTLPRGGSDIAAVYAAYRLGAPEVRFWKDGGGIREGTAIVADLTPQQLLDRIGETIRPMHPAAVRLAIRHGIGLRMEDPFQKAASTTIPARPADPVAPRVVLDPRASALLHACSRKMALKAGLDAGGGRAIANETPTDQGHQPGEGPLFPP